MSTQIEIEKVSDASLFKSEPNPSWFGNGRNEVNNPNWSKESKNWLKSRFHFSFAEYHDATRSSYGVLRVMNDDLVQPDRGFGTHPHRDMEIVTYIVEGELTHQDSMGTKETLTRGSIQYMTAGTGVRHSEYNHNKSKPLRFIQMWVIPNKYGLKPIYGGMKGSLEQRHNKWAHLVSNCKGKQDTPVKINQDANMYVSELDQGQRLELEIQPNRMGYLLCIEGAIKLGDESLKRHDAARLLSSGKINIQAEENSHILYWEMLKQ